MERETIFQPENREKQEKTGYRIYLHIIRHGEKDGPNEVTEAEDIPMRLTLKGKLQARERGIELQTQGGVSSGSTRQRTHETALHMAHANNPNITGEENLEELLEKTDRKVWVNMMLDMPFVKDHPDFQEIMEQHGQGRLLKYFAEEDDAIVNTGGERSVSKYGVQARNIASLVERFARIAQKMADRKERAEERGEKSESEREHNMSTHGSAAEPFLAEVIRRTIGEEERQQFLDAVPNGIAVSEGMNVDIQALNGQDDSLIRIWFSVGKEGHKYTYDYNVPLSVVQSIVRDFSSKGNDDII